MGGSVWKTQAESAKTEGRVKTGGGQIDGMWWMTKWSMFIRVMGGAGVR